MLGYVILVEPFHHLYHPRIAIMLTGNASLIPILISIHTYVVACVHVLLLRYRCVTKGYRDIHAHGYI